MRDILILTVKLHLTCPYLPGNLVTSLSLVGHMQNNNRRSVQQSKEENKQYCWDRIGSLRFHYARRYCSDTTSTTACSASQLLNYFSPVYCKLTNQSQRLTYQLPTLQATARLLVILSVPPGALMYSLATAYHTYSLPHVALDWQSLPERLCSRTPASTVLYRTGHSVMNYSFAVVLCVSESVKDIFRLHACLQDCCSLFPHLLITTWPSTTADYG
ncbi:hypothetical protein J6590_069466 [Homalodisca vitripennis]|nr:hypothetical protein J6590_069466 [Homalodisca vitripennis]